MPHRLKKVLNALRANKMLILVDDASEPPVGYFFASSSSISAKDVSFMVNNARGLICAAMSEERVMELGLSMMTASSNDNSPQFTVSVEARQGISTGISAADRARTLRVLTTTQDARRDLVMPGHIFPIRAKKGGVLVRNAAPEAAVDLLTLANLVPVGALCHCLDDSGSYLDEAGIMQLQKSYSLELTSVSDVIRHRMASESIVEKIAEAQLPTKQAGTFRAIAFRSPIDGAEHLALVKGDIAKQNELGEQVPVLARVQSQHVIGDLLGTGENINRQLIVGALREIEHEERGVFIYVRHPGKGLLSEHARAIATNSYHGTKTSQLRELGIGAQILSSLGAKKIRLLTNSDREILGAKAFQIEIVEHVSFEPHLRKQLEEKNLPT